MGTALRKHPRHAGLAGLVAGLLLSQSAAAAAIAAGLVLLTVAVVGRRGALALVTCALVLGGTWIGAERRQAIDRSALGPWLSREVRARGHVVKRERATAAQQRARVRLTRIGPRHDPWLTSVHELVQLRVRGRGAPIAGSIGDEVELVGSLEPLESRSRGRFDYAAYLRRQGVHALVEAEAIHLTGRRRGGLAGAVDALRRRAERGVGDGLPPRLAALARGIVLGQDELIDDRIADDFKDSGLAHLLAVSGQNVTLLALLAWPLLAALGLGRRARLLVVLALIAVYVPLTGAGPSIMRAGAMGAAGTVAALAGRPASRWYAVLLAAAFTLMVDPRAWLDPGWQLSFAAVVGILLLHQRLAAMLSRLPGALAAGIAVTVAATLATAPLMAFHFERVSLVSLIANLVALPAVAPLMWIGMLTAAVSQLALGPAALANALNLFLLSYLAAIAHVCASAPHAVWLVAISSPLALAGTYAAGAAALAALARLGAGGRRSTVRLACAGLVAIALLASAAARARDPQPPRGLAVTFLDVGQGDSTLIQAPGGVAALVDGGPPEADVAAKLRDAGVRRLDVVALTHAQRDHAGGIERVVRELPVGVLLDGAPGDGSASHRRIVAAAHARGARVVAASAGQVLRLAGLTLRVLGPGEEQRRSAADPNDRALVLLASHGGVDTMLPADAESTATLPLDLREVELLKVAHHGSADAGLAQLLERTRPELAVIEVGARNPYGHPDPGTVATLAAHVPRVLRTDRDGDVRVTLAADGGLAVETAK